MSLEACAVLCRLAHLPSAFCRAGARGSQVILKAKAFLARQVVQLQFTAFAAMLTSMARWRDDGKVGERIVVLGISHQWDDSPQQLRESKPSPDSRTAKQRVSKTVLVQRSVVQSIAAEFRQDGSKRLFSRAENFIVPPLLMHGKSAEWLRAAMLASSKWRGGHRCRRWHGHAVFVKGMRCGGGNPLARRCVIEWAMATTCRGAR